MDYMTATRTEIVDILHSLQQHWNCLEEELIQINKDIRYCQDCLEKYGEHFRVPLEYLKDLKRSKKDSMKQIISNMESFNQQLQGGRELVRSLNTNAIRHPSVQQKFTSNINPAEVVYVTTATDQPQHYKLITKSPTNEKPIKK